MLVKPVECHRYRAVISMGFNSGLAGPVMGNGNKKIKSFILSSSKSSTFQSPRKAFLPREDYSQISSISIQAAFSVRKYLDLLSFLKSLWFLRLSETFRSSMAILLSRLMRYLERESSGVKFNQK
jgi:hypothetical protein